MSTPYVLIVDDNALNVKLVTFMLHARDVVTKVATTADAALRCVEENRPAVILMDVQLPGTDGLTLTRALRTDPRNRDIAIIAVTAYAMATDEQAARDAGCSGFISKPLDIMALGNLVLSLLGREVPHVTSGPA